MFFSFDKLLVKGSEVGKMYARVAIVVSWGLVVSPLLKVGPSHEVQACSPFIPSTWMWVTSTSTMPLGVGWGVNNFCHKTKCAHSNMQVVE